LITIDCTLSVFHTNSKIKVNRRHAYKSSVVFMSKSRTSFVDISFVDNSDCFTNLSSGVNKLA